MSINSVAGEHEKETHTFHHKFYSLETIKNFHLQLEVVRLESGSLVRGLALSSCCFLGQEALLQNVNLHPGV